jgi:hypothetical protein
MRSNRLRRQGRIAWKLVAARRDAHTLAGLNGDMVACAEVMRRSGVGRSTEGDQQAKGQSGTHPDTPYRTSLRPCGYERPRSQGEWLHDRSNWRDHGACRGMRFAAALESGFGLADIVTAPANADCWSKADPANLGVSTHPPARVRTPTRATTSARSASAPAREN